MKTLVSSLSRLGLSVAAVMLVSCAGAKFNRDWDAAVAAYESGEAGDDPVTGPWTGTWLSHVNAHTGDLRCLVTPLDISPEAAGNPTDGRPYQFRYHATWGDWFQGGFAARFGVTRDGSRGYRVKGEQDLGLFGGFQHEGWIKDDRFEATYASDMGDHGVFEMKRP